MEYRPWTWKVPESTAKTTKSITRQDATARVSGQAVFTRDVYLPGNVLHALVDRVTEDRAAFGVYGIDLSRIAACFYVIH